MSDKGYVWFALQNEKIDYTDLSIRLAKSIKKHNQINKVCVITDQEIDNPIFDHVIKLNNANVNPFSNEYKIFSLTPFTHTIKLEADMMLSSNIDWWWNHLCQHNLIISNNCFNYKNQVVKNYDYRKLFLANDLPNLYNALTYFRKSKFAERFYKICELITKNWNYVKEECLIACDSNNPTTDEVYALAYKMLDPLKEKMVEYDWFKFTHNKNAINGLPPSVHNDDYLLPMMVQDRLYVGGYRQQGIWHYQNKDLPKELDARIF